MPSLDPDDPLKGLDFTIPSFGCEVAKQPWTLGARFDAVPLNGPCPNPATILVDWRVCPCIADIPRWHELHPELKDMQPLVYWGLAVTRASMCDAHLGYFVTYLQYPFVCGQCKVGFASAREMLLRAEDLNEG